MAAIKNGWPIWVLASKRRENSTRLMEISKIIDSLGAGSFQRGRRSQHTNSGCNNCLENTKLQSHYKKNGPYVFQKNIVYFRPFHGNNPTTLNELSFDSSFQGGNLDVAIKTGSNQYDLFMRVDSNTCGHFNWFYFKAKSSNTGIVKFNICNFTRHFNLYSRGLKPYFVSKGRQWQQVSSVIGYEQTRVRYQFIYKRLSKVPNFSRLSFQFNFQSDQQVYFAYCPPYAYSRLLAFTKQIQPKVKIYSLCKSQSGLHIPIIKIGNGSRVALATGRVHPGQSNSSFVIQGMIRKLLEDEQSLKQLQEQLTFIIIPMLNPDGVVVGNFRTGLFGRDLNRQYSQQSNCRQVNAFKKLVIQIKQKFDIFLYLDFHGHSQRKNVFFYGPSWPICQSQYLTCRIFPKMIAKRTTMFRYHSCSFRIQECKRSTARAMMFEGLAIPYVYTVQSSVASYYCSEKMTTFDFKMSDFVYMGEILGESIKEFVQFIGQIDQLRKTKRDRKKQQQQEQEQAIKKRSPQKHKIRVFELEDLKSFIKKKDQELLAMLDEKAEKEKIQEFLSPDSDAEQPEEAVQNIRPVSSKPLCAKQVDQKKASRRSMSKQLRMTMEQKPISQKSQRSKKLSNSERKVKDERIYLKPKEIGHQSICLDSQQSRRVRESYRKSFQMAVTQMQERKLQKNRKNIEVMRKMEQKLNQIKESKLIHIDLRRIELPNFMNRVQESFQATTIVSELSKEIVQDRQRSRSKRANKIDEISKLNRGLVPSAFYKMRQFYNRRIKDEDSVADNFSLNIRRFK